MSVKEIIEVITALRFTFESLKTRPLKYRLQQLKGISGFLTIHEKEIIDALYQDLHRPALETWAGEIGPTLSEVRYAIKNLKKWMKPERVPTFLSLQPAKSYIYKEPLGLVLIISPWNYPIQLNLVPLIGALAAGNCAILKPSELAPLTSELLVNYLPNYVDNESVRVIEGGIPESTLLLSQKFDHIFYTGNPSIAKVIMEAAAKNLTPVTLELGGKSPCIIDENINFDVAIKRILWGKFMNAGQVCLASDYVLVHKNAVEKVMDKIQKTLIEFYGSNPKQSANFARIINKKHFDRLRNYLREGEVVIGGEIDEQELYISPTIMRNIHDQANILKEEIFGPILPILVVNDIEEAINYINARPKPLTIYLFSNNKTVQNNIIQRTSSGAILINHTTIHFIDRSLPFGGIGTSGMGAYHGKFSFDTFSHKKAVLVKPERFDIPFIYPPYSERKLKWLKWFL